MLNAKISPSLMCVDAWTDAPDAVDALNALGTEYYHVDVMDGHFVPNFALGTNDIKKLRARTDTPLDIHLMVERPEEVLPWLDIQPGEYVSVHVESTRHLQSLLREIRARRAKPMAALNPATPLCVLDEIWDDVDGVLVMTVNPGFAGQKLVPRTLEKLARLRAMLNASGYAQTEIEVDGNVSFENAAKMRAAGANIFVGGTSSVFAAGRTIGDNLRRLREKIAEGERVSV